MEAMRFSDPLDCAACPRLAAHLSGLRARDPNWHNRPVPSFGELSARFLIVGLAPGERGANRTGRPFSGDVAGELLYPALHRFGFAAVPAPLDDKGQAHPKQRLLDARISNAVRCLPPGNKPLPIEIHACNIWLRQEIAAMPNLAAILVLGAIAHQAVLRAFSLKRAEYPFGHACRYNLPPPFPALFTSYHCSGYNWRTGRLSKESFENVFADVSDFLRECSAGIHDGR
ncbi:MAG: uracil-DNA glycosylase [Zoogloeaceae bacterium]|jgi:uracil-DNA glycosylase|nr:uracil-DNA glycosylase [Zoogloeaceae bacterium]